MGEGEAAAMRQTGAGEPLRRRVFRGTAWTILGIGGGQVIRFASGVVLSWLLWPGAFGVMAMINVVLDALNMFSDLGAGASVIQNRRGDEREFLRTAWTVQSCRGVVLWGLALALTWPASVYYGEPDLLLYMPVVAFVSVFHGLNSMNLYLMNRALNIRGITLIDLSSQISGSALTITWAYLHPSVWALVVGTLLSAGMKCGLSHLVFRRPRMMFAFDREAARAMFRYGRWIFVATACSFFVARADRLVLGKFMTTSEFGVYHYAAQMAAVMPLVLNTVANRVLFPVYARSAEIGHGALRRHVLKTRAALMAAALPPLWVLVVFGQPIVEFIYPEAFRDAGWMLQIIAIGTCFNVIINPATIVFLAVGDSFRHWALLMSRTGLLLACLFAGAWLGVRGVAVAGWELTPSLGVILGYVVSQVAYYPVFAFMARRYRVWLPRLDFGGMAVSAAVVVAGLWFLRF